MNIIGYARTSTIDQVNGIEAQKVKINAWSMIEDTHNLVDVVVEHGSAADIKNRPGFQKVLTRLKNDECDAVVVTKLDRLTRSLKDWQKLIEGVFNEKSGKVLYCVSDPVDTSTATGRLMLNMILTVAQWEREVISERTKDSLLLRKETGSVWNGSIPFGWQRDPENDSLLIHDPRKQDMLRLVHGLRLKGRTWARIAKAVNRWYDNNGKPWRMENIRTKWRRARYYWKIWGDPRGFDYIPSPERKRRERKDDKYMRPGFRSWEKNQGRGE